MGQTHLLQLGEDGNDGNTQDAADGKDPAGEVFYDHGFWRELLQLALVELDRHPFKDQMNCILVGEKVVLRVGALAKQERTREKERE